MSVSFVTRKCTQCAGKLQYIKDKKIWKCLYCGAEIEREEQYDGLFTIKNVVRQTLLDVAYRRLDSAAKNLVECEKIDSRYLGTLIAKISFEMISVITPGACSERDKKNFFSQLKKNYELLKEISTSVSEEEEALYDFLDESDIFAILILVYDSLNDIVRRDFVANLLNPKDVYSKEANGNLLVYALKNQNNELVDHIISNTDNIDVREALNELLQKYPDVAEKSNNVQKLLDTNLIIQEDKSVIENYLSSSQDSSLTKSQVLVLVLNGGIKINFNLALEKVVNVTDVSQTKDIVSAYCKNKLNDEEVLRALSFSYECGNCEMALVILDCLELGNQYVLVPAKLIISMLSEKAYSANEKLLILKKSLGFKMDVKGMNAIITDYLCFNLDNPNDRKVILSCLFEKVDNLQTGTVNSYVLKCVADADEKPNVVNTIFEKNLNMSFFKELLSKYINESIDKKEVKEKIFEILSDKGLRVDFGSLKEYICHSNDEVQQKIKIIKKTISNGSKLRSDLANMYLEYIAPVDFSSELFAVIFTPTSSFSSKAIENYLLYFKDRKAIKVQNTKKIIEHLSTNIYTVHFQITHLGKRVFCNLLQAYILNTIDSKEVAIEIVDELLIKQKIKINSVISVPGSDIRFKKYVGSNKEKLSEVTNLLCEKYKVYSMIF